MEVGFLLNGEAVRVRVPDPTRTVLDWLREERGLTGTKEACREGDCGACSVIVTDGDGARALNACILLLPQIDGRALRTVEGLAGPEGEPHPVQEAMVEHHGSQCGFCTPGFVVTMAAAHLAGRRDHEDQLAGCLCRCTGYAPILRAARAVEGAPVPPWMVEDLGRLRGGPRGAAAVGGTARLGAAGDRVAAMSADAPAARGDRSGGGGASSMAAAPGEGSGLGRDGGGALASGQVGASSASGAPGRDAEGGDAPGDDGARGEAERPGASGAPATARDPGRGRGGAGAPLGGSGPGEGFEPAEADPSGRRDPPTASPEPGRDRVGGEAPDARPAPGRGRAYAAVAADWGRRDPVAGTSASDAGGAGEGPAPWVRPRSSDELAAWLLSHPDATLVAGATDVGLWVTKGLRDLGPVAFLAGCSDLRGVEVGEGEVRVGAMATVEAVREALAPLHPSFGELLRRYGSVQVRNAATLGGNVANGSPIGDGPPALIALGAALHLRRGDARRSMPLEDFFLDYGRQDRAPGEFVEAITVPRQPDRLRVWKLSKRFDQDISAVCGAFALRVEEGVVAGARIAFGGVAATPRRARAVEAALAGAPWSEATVRRALGAFAEDFQPISDMRASSDYRLGAARNMLLRCWLEDGGVSTQVLRVRA